jgi:hypothetical protein
VTGPGTPPRELILSISGPTALARAQVLTATASGGEFEWRADQLNALPTLDRHAGLISAPFGSQPTTSFGVPTRLEARL